MSVKQYVYAAGGCLALGMGAVGAVVPLLPAFPFLLLAAFCFARASKRLDRWFRGTKLYRDNLEGYVSGRGMARAEKMRIMVVVTLLMAVGFAMMHQVPLARAVLVCVWALHIVYFVFGVKSRSA